MRLLSSNEYSKYFSEYDDKIIYFPIITSVIEKRQNGYVFEESGMTLIVHKFGFAYIFGEKNNAKLFIEKIKKDFSFIYKLRIYDPDNRLAEFKDLAAMKSTRAKYIQNQISFDSHINIVKIQSVDNKYKNIFELDLCHRFWNNCEDFKNYSLSVIDMEKKGICYAAARNNCFAETDIYVKEVSRGKSLGTKLVQGFCKNCVENNIKPIWDCYTNNTASVKLAEKNNFTKLFEYSYYNL